jgi:polysaccharide biosynthesis protein PslH
VRVLFLTHRLPYAPNRGDRARAFHMLRVLAERNEVDLFSLVHDDDEASRGADIQPYVVSLTMARIRRLHQARRIVQALRVGSPLTHALLDAFGTTSALANLVRRRRPHVLLAYCSSMARFAFEPCCESLPMVLDMVDVDSEKWRELATRTTGPLRWVYRREAKRLACFERTAAMRAAVNVVVNERERLALSHIAPAARLSVIENGVDVRAFRPTESPCDQPRVVFCGVMNYPPNEQAAIWLARQVWPSVIAANPAARLTLVGASPTKAVRDLEDGEAGITVTGAVPDVRRYLWQSAVAVAPLWIARGVQNKVLEAVAAGLPCVITPAVEQGLPAAVLPACTVAKSAQDVANEILALLRCSAAERRAKAGRAHLADLAWERQLDRLQALLTEARDRATGSHVL